MGSTLIPFPDVPDFPGVPALNRAVNSGIASSPALSITLGTAQTILLGALQQPSQWGIYDQFGDQFGIAPDSQSTLQAIGSALLSQLTGGVPTVLSTYDFEYRRETRISDHVVEKGKFASYNKVMLPANPVVTLILQGSQGDGTYLLNALEDACASTNLYSVVTPEYVYANYSLERFTYARKASRGVTLFIVEVSLKEIRQTTSALSNSPITAPQNAAATPQVSNGVTQPAAVPASTALQLKNGISSMLTPYFGGP
jgi:hypothetical protein